MLARAPRNRFGIVWGEHFAAPGTIIVTGAGPFVCPRCIAVVAMVAVGEQRSTVRFIVELMFAAGFFGPLDGVIHVSLHCTGRGIDLTFAVRRRWVCRRLTFSHFLR